MGLGNHCLDMDLDTKCTGNTNRKNRKVGLHQTKKLIYSGGSDQYRGKTIYRKR